MTSTKNSAVAGTRRRPDGIAGVAAAVVVASIVAIVMSAVIAAIAYGAGASHSFQPLDMATYAPFIVVGLLAGAIAWNLVRNRSADPARLLSRLAPTVVVVSLVPDVVVGATGGLPGSSWVGVTALMAMHLVVAACGIVSFRFFLPLTTGHESSLPTAG